MNTNKNLDLGKIREKIDKLDSQLYWTNFEGYYGFKQGISKI